MTDQFGDTGGVPAVQDAKLLTMPSTLERLERKKDALELELFNINEALQALRANPEVARVVNAISKLGHF